MVPRLPFRTYLIETARAVLLRFQEVFERDMIAQSVAERLARAALAAGLLWLAIWWALS
jgi:hypothetical protein